jgi:glycosyltransferase involved in cell wall biosynthesis
LAPAVRILLDLLPVLPRGGGLQNARNLWRVIAEEGGDHRWLALARPGHGLGELPRAPFQELRQMEPGGALGRVAFGLRGLPALARNWADVVFVPMGAGPLRSPVPVVMGWHDSTQAYPELALDAGGSTERRLRGAYARAAARRADRICVQTPTMARRLARVWGIPEGRFRVVPNGPSSFLRTEAPAPETPPPGVRRVIVPGEPKPAKNLEIVPAVAAALARRGVKDVELVLTVPPDPNEWTGPLEEALARHPKGVPVRRIGQVPHAQLGPLYRSAAVVLLPSLAESFSATCVEAMHFGVPLVTSDRDFARDVCGDAALYAEPTDPEALATQIVRALDDAELRRTLRAAGFARLPAFPDWSERLRLYLAACREAVEGARSERAG